MTLLGVGGLGAEDFFFFLTGAGGGVAVVTRLDLGLAPVTRGAATGSDILTRVSQHVAVII